ncbi:MAG: beta-lactamase family protein [Phycisphaerales bacterium]|nr:beta-lactamase family protein [Phycisphaerales bacterium]
MAAICAMFFAFCILHSELPQTTQPATTTSQPAADLATRLDAKIDDAMEKLRLSSVAVGVIREKDVVYRAARGFANREKSEPATCDTLYGIGSITKTFTTTLLVMLRDDGVLALDDPISKYLPSDLPLPTSTRGDRQITLRHLATHSSGLPRVPPNLVALLPDPYGGYSVDDLYKGLGATGLIAPIGAKCAYSNLGVGLLGHLLERAASKGYDELLQTRIFGPLEMTNSFPRPTPELLIRMARPYKGERCEKDAHTWTFDVLAPAGSIVSSVNDMMKYVALQFRAGDAIETPIRGGSLAELHRPQRLLDERWSAAVGLGWHITPDRKIGEIVWHNGGLDGFHSFVGFCAKKRVGVVVLTNCDRDIDGLAMEILKLAAIGD